MVFTLNPGDDDSNHGDTRPIIGFSELMLTVAWFARIAACSFLSREDDSVPKVRLPETIDTKGGPRTARNMLTPMGIPKEAWMREEWTPKDDYPEEWVTSAARPCVIVGEMVYRKTPIFSPDGCLPDSVGALLSTKQGIRRLLPEELAK